MKNFFVLLMLLLIRSSWCQPVQSSGESGEENGDPTNQDYNTILNSATRVVDLNNLDARILEQLRSNNINLTALRAEQALRTRKLQRDGYNLAPAPLTQAPNDEHSRRE